MSKRRRRKKQGRYNPDESTNTHPDNLDRFHTSSLQHEVDPHRERGHAEKEHQAIEADDPGGEAFT